MDDLEIRGRGVCGGAVVASGMNMRSSPGLHLQHDSIRVAVAVQVMTIRMPPITAPVPKSAE